MAPDLSIALWLISSLRAISQIEDDGLVNLVNVILCICGARTHFEFPSLYHDTVKMVRTFAVNVALT